MNINGKSYRFCNSDFKWGVHIQTWFEIGGHGGLYKVFDINKTLLDTFSHDDWMQANEMVSNKYCK